jgi:hypothetical protein
MAKGSIGLDVGSTSLLPLDPGWRGTPQQAAPAPTSPPQVAPGPVDRRPSRPRRPRSSAGRDPFVPLVIPDVGTGITDGTTDGTTNGTTGEPTDGGVTPPQGPASSRGDRGQPARWW